MDDAVVLRPNPGPQEIFLATLADIAIFGGGAGSGKTWALLFEVLRHSRNPKLRAVIFRRISNQITLPGGLWDTSGELYPLVGAKPIMSPYRHWEFPDGGVASFHHLQHESDKYSWQGTQADLFAFDELTHFTESQFFYLMSRARSSTKIDPYFRATCNADADSWLATFLEWWIDQQTGFPDPTRAGKLRYMLRVNDELVWADDRADLERRYPDLTRNAPPKSVTFIPALISDNPELLKNNPGYLASLQAMTYLDQQRLLHNNWKIKPSAGNVFNRSDFKIVDYVPPANAISDCIFWDLAATEREQKGSRNYEPSYTAAVHMRLIDGKVYILDCVDFQEGPAIVEQEFVNHSKRTANTLKNRAWLKIRWEREPGSAGKREAYRFVQLLQGYDAQAVTPQGEKLVRARPLASQSNAGNVYLLRGRWNDRWINHMHNQPQTEKDIMDASSGAYIVLTAKAKKKKRPRTRTAGMY